MTRQMRLLGFSYLCLTGMLVACGSTPPADNGGSSSSSSGTTSGSSSSSGTIPEPPSNTATTTPPTVDDTTFGDGCGPNPCEPCDPACEPHPLCIASVWTCECMCPETSTGDPPDVCDSLETAVDIWIESSLNPPMDCGIVGLDDDLAAWQAAHDCAAATLDGGTFRVQWETDAKAPAARQFAIAARFVAKDVERVWYEVSGDFTLTEYECSAMTVTQKCEVAVGEMCLTCERAAPVAELCMD